MTFWGLLACLVNERTFTINPSFQALLSVLSYGLCGRAPLYKMFQVVLVRQLNLGGILACSRA